MKVAFTSSTGDMIDQHFGMACAFSIWEITGDDARFLMKVENVQPEGDEEDRISGRADLISDCSIVYTMQIGGPAAAKLISRKIHPMKTNTAVPVAEIVDKLQGVLRGNPPPWLRKAMGGHNGNLSGE
jgi:nitrogen fixation protein NifX